MNLPALSSFLNIMKTSVLPPVISVITKPFLSLLRLRVSLENLMNLPALSSFLNIMKTSVLPPVISVITKPILSLLRLRVSIDPADRDGWLLLVVYALVGFLFTYL